MLNRAANSVFSIADNVPQQVFFNPSFCSSKWIFNTTPIAIQPSFVDDYYTTPTIKDTNPDLDPININNLTYSQRLEVYQESIGKDSLFAFKNNGISIRDFYDEQLALYNSINRYKSTPRGSEPGYYSDWRTETTTIIYNQDGSIDSSQTFSQSGTVNDLADLPESYYFLVVEEGDPGVFFVKKRETIKLWFTPYISPFENSTANLQKEFIDEVKLFFRYTKTDNTQSPSLFYDKYDNVPQSTSFDDTEISVPLPPEPAYTLTQEAQYIDRYDAWQHRTRYKEMTWPLLLTINPKPSTWL
jgi:hypothetical protein